MKAGVLRTLVTARGPKFICKGVYELTTGHETDKNSGGTYATYKFRNAGWLKPDSPIERMAIEMFDAWKDRKIEIEREPGDDSFDTQAMDAAKGSEM